MSLKNSILYLSWFLCLALSAVLLFEVIRFMQQHVICAWDEAVYTHNACSMQQNKEWLRYYFFDEPNMYNSKPPLVIWLQTLSISIFGHTEWAIRWPTLLALLMLLFYFFSWTKQMKLPSLFMPALCFALLAIPGLLRPHVFLTGDLDALLVLFTGIIQAYTLYAFSQKALPPRIYTLLLILFLLAYFTKSSASFLILPSILFFAIGYGQLSTILRNKSFYFHVFLFLGIVLAYYALREVYEPGHMQVVFHSEYLRLYEKVMHWHVQPFHFYFDIIYNRENPFGLYVSIILLPLFFLLPHNPNKKLGLLLLLGILGNIFLVSLPPVKLEWYIAPTFPLWAMLNALAFVSIMDFLFEKKKLTWLGIPLILLFLSPFYTAFTSQKKFQTQLDPVEMEAHFMKNLPSTYQNYTVLKLNEHDEVAYIYAHWIKSPFQRITIQHQLSDIMPGDTVLVCDASLREKVSQQCTILLNEPQGMLAVKK